MSNNTTQAKQYTPFVTVAVIVPLVSASVGANWLPTLVTALVAVLLYACIPAWTYNPPAWLKTLRLATIVFLLAHYFRQTAVCWPSRGAEYIVPAALGVLAFYTVCRGEEIALRSANVLRYGVFAVIAATIYAGMKEIKTVGLVPTGELPNGELILALLLPMLLRGEQKEKKNWLPFAAIAVSLMTAGARKENLYSFSKNISLNGVTEHMESIMASAITIGHYALLCMLMITAGESVGERKWMQGAAILAAYAIAISGTEVKTAVMILAIVLLWGIAPGFDEVKRKMKKREKSA